MEEAGRDIAPQDREPEQWVAGEAILELFDELNQWRSYGEFGPQRLTLHDLESYCGFYGVMLGLFEVKAIRMVDNIYLEKLASSSDTGSDGGK